MMRLFRSAAPEPSTQPVVLLSSDGDDIIWHSSERPQPAAVPVPAPRTEPAPATPRPTIVPMPRRCLQMIRRMRALPVI